MLSELVRQDRLVVVKELDLEAPKTKLLATKLKELDLSNVLILNDAVTPASPSPVRVLPSRVKVSASSATKRPERNSSTTSWAEAARNEAETAVMRTTPQQETS